MIIYYNIIINYLFLYSLKNMAHSDLHPTESNESLNTLLQLKEEKEYWEDKLLELKLKACKNSFLNSKNEKMLESKLSSLQAKNNLQKQKIAELNEQISQIKSSEKSKENQLASLDSLINLSTHTNQELETEIKQLNDYLVNLNNTENIVEHILSFPQEFRNKIYNICSERVSYVLQFNTPMGYPQHQVNNNIKSEYKQHIPQNFVYGYGVRPPMMMFYPPPPGTQFVNNNIANSYINQNGNK